MNHENTQPPYPDRDFWDWIEPMPESARPPREFRPDEVRHYTFDEIDAMDGIQFELFIKHLLESGAYSDLCTTPASGDQGADLLGFTPEHKKAVAQTKRWRGAVGTSAIQEVLGAMFFYDAEVAFVFTNSSITSGARLLAAKDPRIHLVDRMELGHMIRNVFDRDGPQRQRVVADKATAESEERDRQRLHPDVLESINRMFAGAEEEGFARDGLAEYDCHPSVDEIDAIDGIQLPPHVLESINRTFAEAAEEERLARETCGASFEVLGKAPKQNMRTGQSVADALNIATAIAPTAQSSPLLTPRRQRKARRPRATRGGYQRFRPKPPPLVIVNEPWTAGQWLALIVVLALIVAGLWFYNEGGEQRKWQSIEATSRAIQGR